MIRDIFLVTRFNIINHGSILQTLATEEFFNSLGYNTTTINYINKKEKFPRIITETLVQNKKWNCNLLKRIIFYIIKFPSGLISHILFSKYRKKILNLSKEYNSLDELKKIDFSNALLCSGSDQLWGPIIDGDLDPVYFCAFSNEKKIAFSSSIGRSVDFSSKYLDYLKQYEFITTREESVTFYLKTKNINNSMRIYDPTLMVDEKYWYNFASKKNEKGKYILLYRLHNNPEFEKQVKIISKKKKLKVIRITNSIEDIFMFGKAKINVNPETFLSLIRDAEYVLTDSFHCTLFSLIFKKKFVCISPGETSIRISDLLAEFGLENHLIDKLTLDSLELNDVNYDQVFKTIHNQRNLYIELIKNNMEQLNENRM